MNYCVNFNFGTHIFVYNIVSAKLRHSTCSTLVDVSCVFDNRIPLITVSFAEKLNNISSLYFATRCEPTNTI